jgi:putative SOS response-associated peptidase YedK
VGTANYFSGHVTNIEASGLVPFWTKRNPDYGSKMKTINCRDDSLFEDRGMWTTMKKQKRCIIVAQGFYEWLKKNNGKEKIPHFTKRKDGQLMCFAGLWDRVQFEGKLVPRLYATAMQRQPVVKPSVSGFRPAYQFTHALCTCSSHD